MPARLSRFILVALLANALPANATQPFPAMGMPGVQQVMSPSSSQVGLVTKVDVGTAIGTYGALVSLRATFLSGNAPLKGKTVVFSIDDKEAPWPSMTGPDGKAELTYEVLGSLAAGEHVIKARFAGEAGIPGVTGTGRLAVLKGATNFDSMNAGISFQSQPAPGKAVVRAGGRIFRVADGKGIDGRAVDILVDGKKIGTAATNANGQFNFEEPWTKGGGNFTVLAEFAGDSHYTGSAKGSVASYTPPPPPAPPKLLTAYHSLVTLMPLGPLMVGGHALMMTTVTTERDGGNPVPNVKVDLFVPTYGPSDGNSHSTTRTVTSGPNGIASADIELVVGGNLWFASRINDPMWKDGNGNDPVSSTQTIFEIAKAPLAVIVNGPKSAKVGEKITLNVELRNAAMPKPAPFVFVGASDSASTPPASGSGAETGMNGTATLSYTIPTSLGIGSRQLHIFASSADSRNYIAKIVAYPITIMPKDN